MFSIKTGSISSIALAAALGILGIIAFKTYQHQKQHEVILIAGTSSAGKSSIINELTKLIGKNYQVIKIDDFNTQAALEQKVKSWGWDPKKSTLDDFMAHYVMTKTGMSLEMGLPSKVGQAIQKETFDAMHIAFFKHVKLAAKKSNIIIDTVFDTTNNFDQFSTIMHSNKIIKVLVYCPLDLIQERVERRNLSGKPEEQRSMFQAFTQFAAIYKLQESSHEQIVDTISSECMLIPLKKAIDDLIKQLEQTQPKNDIARAKLKGDIESVRQFYMNFIHQFKLNTLKEIVIVPMHHYDLIVNSGTREPIKNAHEIFNYIRHITYMRE